MSAVIYNMTTAGLLIVMFRSAVLLVGEETIRTRPFPWAAAGLLVVAAVGVVVQLVWAGSRNLLDHDPSKPGWWRPVTAVFLQNGALGVIWNLITLGVMAALAEWFWGHRHMLALFVIGALLPEHLDALLGVSGHSSDPRKFVGSSGVTYFLSAALVGALAVQCALRVPSKVVLANPRLPTLLLSLVVPVGGLLMWFLQANGHGLVSTEGFTLGAALSLVAKRATSRTGSDPRLDNPSDRTL